MQPAIKPNVISNSKNGKSSSADLKSVATSLEECKENAQPNLINFELQDEVFIDDQVQFRQNQNEVGIRILDPFKYFLRRI